MKSYLNLLSHILENGEKREDRTNVGTISSFGHQLKFDLRDGFPAVTTKKLAWKGVVSELIWFLEGSDDERRLAEIRYNKNRDELTDIDKYPTIWTDNADNQGKNLGYENSTLVKKLGPVYGVQWRNWGDKDQIKELLDSLKNNPTSRRHILSAWNVTCASHEGMHRHRQCRKGLHIDLGEESPWVCLGGGRRLTAGQAVITRTICLSGCGWGSTQALSSAARRRSVASWLVSS